MQIVENIPFLFKALTFTIFLGSAIFHFCHSYKSNSSISFSKTFTFAISIAGIIPVFFIFIGYLYPSAKIIIDSLFLDTAYLFSVLGALYFAFKQIITLKTEKDNALEKVEFKEITQ